MLPGIHNANLRCGATRPERQRSRFRVEASIRDRRGGAKSSFALSLVVIPRALPRDRIMLAGMAVADVGTGIGEKWAGEHHGA